MGETFMILSRCSNDIVLYESATIVLASSDLCIGNFLLRLQNAKDKVLKSWSATFLKITFEVNWDEALPCHRPSAKRNWLSKQLGHLSEEAVLWWAHSLPSKAYPKGHFPWTFWRFKELSCTWIPPTPTPAPTPALQGCPQPNCKS